MCVLLHLLSCTALRGHIIFVEGLYFFNCYYYLLSLQLSFFFFFLLSGGYFFVTCARTAPPIPVSVCSIFLCPDNDMAASV